MSPWIFTPSLEKGMQRSVTFRSTACAARGLVGIICVATSAATAQTTEHATFITRLGTDTIAVEQFTRSATRLEGDLLLRSPATRVLHYVATLGPVGQVTRFEYAAHKADGSPLPRQPHSVTLTFAGDSAVRTTMWGDSTSTKTIAAPGPVFPQVGGSYALLEPVIAYLRHSGHDSADVRMLGPGSSVTAAVPFALAGKDSARYQSFGSPVLMRVDASGAILGVDGRQTTVKIVAERVPAVNIQALATAFAARDQQGNAMGQLSPGDSVKATVGNAHVTINYSRPSQRGRIILGGLVPWNQVWRTGANAATQFTTDADLVIGGTTVPAGKYTLWTLPTPVGVTLIVNKETGQWGTDYHAAQDFARIDMTSTPLATPVEQFTIAIAPGATGNQLQMRWGSTQWAVPIAQR